MSNFQAFAAAIAAQFQRMSQGELFHADISGTQQDLMSKTPEEIQQMIDALK